MPFLHFKIKIFFHTTLVKAEFNFKCYLLIKAIPELGFSVECFFWIFLVTSMYILVSRAFLMILLSQLSVLATRVCGSLGLEFEKTRQCLVAEILPVTYDG